MLYTGYVCKCSEPCILTLVQKHYFYGMYSGIHEPTGDGLYGLHSDSLICRL